MHRFTLTFLAALWAGSLGGCAIRGNQEMLESRLRLQEDRMIELESRLQGVQSELVASRAECDLLRHRLAQGGGNPILAEQAAELFRASGIRFHPLLTGTVDRDGEPGGERLTAVLTPHDSQDQLVKLPGQIELKLVDLTLPEERQTLAEWSFDIDQARELWHNGFLASGYLMRLPLEPSTAPTTGQPLILHARLTTPDGREFAATHEIRANQTETPAATVAGQTPETDQPGVVRVSAPGDQPVPVPSPGPQPRNPFETEPGTAADGRPLQTSDRFTDVTMPQYR